MKELLGEVRTVCMDFYGLDTAMDSLCVSRSQHRTWLRRGRGPCLYAETRTKRWPLWLSSSGRGWLWNVPFTIRAQRKLQ